MNLYEKRKNEIKLSNLQDKIKNLTDIKVNYMSNIEIKFIYNSINNEVKPILDENTIKFLKFIDFEIECIRDEIL